MAMLHLPTTLALIAALAAPMTLGAAEGHDHAAAAATAAPIINTICPMDGKEMKEADMAKAPTVLVTVGEGAEAKQFRIAMCSTECCTEFKKDPVAALRPRFGKNAPGPKTNWK